MQLRQGLMPLLQRPRPAAAAPRLVEAAAEVAAAAPGRGTPAAEGGAAGGVARALAARWQFAVVDEGLEDMIWAEQLPGSCSTWELVPDTLGVRPTPHASFQFACACVF